MDHSGSAPGEDGPQLPLDDGLQSAAGTSAGLSGFGPAAAAIDTGTGGSATSLGAGSATSLGASSATSLGAGSDTSLGAGGDTGIGTGLTGPGPELGGGSPAAGPLPTGSARVIGPLLVYSLLRLALVAALTALLMFFMPLIVALLFAIIVQLPLSWLLFSDPRRRVNEAMAQSSAQRRSDRAKLQSALAGDQPPLDDR
ncbi:MAG: DUF4229 domain-containing protein [Nakamurella sp.]